MPELNWIGKNHVLQLDKQVPYRMIHCDSGLSIGDAGERNLLIEGDNLEALKALLPYYGGKVKCIYIDPPYNTGNEQWVYNDNVNAPEMRAWLGKAVGDELTDRTRHDKWLCMMYPRLKLLHQLLREDGAIFVSIDDNEVANLRLIMDEVFEAQNFVASVIWQKVFSTKNSARHLSESHDYILLYAKNAEIWLPNLLPRTSKQDERYKNPDNDSRGLWTSGDLSARNYYSQGIYAVTCPSGRVIPGPPPGTYWRVSKETFDQWDKEGRIWWGKDGNNVPRLKRFLSAVKEGIVPDTLWFHEDVGNTQEAKKEVLAFLSNDVFITPKPTRLIRRILQLTTEPSDLILDSFAGSGTTGHAVMLQNAEDGGNRRFILIEMERDICRNVTAERLKSVITGNGESLLPMGGFRYCTLDAPLFDAEGHISPDVRFGDLAHHIFFTETGEPLPKHTDGSTPLIGCINNIAYYLLWKGVEDEAILDLDTLRTLPMHSGPKVVYADGCALSDDRLNKAGIIFKQVPYEVKVR